MKVGWVSLNAVVFLAIPLLVFPQGWSMAEDTTPPTGTIVINGNRSATNTPNVTLALTWSDGDGTGVSRMRFSNDGSTWSPWEAPVASRAYTLPAGPDSHRTVRVQYLDRANNRSAVYSDYIRLDTTLPTGTIIINGGASTTASRSVVLGLTWSDGGGSGVTRMRFSDNGSTWTYWMPPAATRSHTLPAGAGYHTVRVQYLDGAGNYSAVFKDYIKLLPAPPQAAFQATPSSGTPPLTVEFEDISVAGDGPIDSWTWDFGDGSPTSSAPNPTHTYTELGIYTVTLTVKSGTSQGQLIKDSAVNVATTVADAFDQFVDPGVPVEEAADGMFAAMDAAFEAGGAEAVQQELESSLYGYLNAGGDPAVLLQRSEAAPAAGLSLDQVQARRLLKAGEKAGYDVILPESQACTNVVIFVNGINTSGPDGKMAYYALKALLGSVIRDKDAAVEFVYNPSACGLWGFIWDLDVECRKQKVLDAIALIGAELQGTDAVVQTLTSRIYAHLAKGRNVIIVPHSQGNFYAQQALWNLSPAERLKVHVVETGSPVSAALDAAGDFRVDIEGDLVGKLGYPRYTEPPFPYEGAWGLGTWINWWIPFKMWDSEVITLLEHHNFQGAYMMGQASQAIRAKVAECCVLPGPVLSGFSINLGANSTSGRTVTLNNLCARSPQEYMASESASFTGAAWLPYSFAPSFHIDSAGDGIKTVYLKARNVDGLESATVSDSITLTELAGGPVITSVSPNPVPGSASAQALTINGSGFASGCTVRLRDYTRNLGPWTKATAFVTAGQVTLSANLGTTNAAWTVQLINPDGSGSEEFSLAVSSAPQGLPTVNAFAVNAGSGATVFRGVTLNGVCTGSPAEYLASESSSFTGATWQVYSTAPSFIITSPGYGTKTVWFKVRNAAGESNTASDTITLEENTGTTETVMLPGNVPLSMVQIPAGSFQMGSPNTERSRWSDEGPVHTVTIGYDYYMGKYEVTQGQWLAVMGSWPGAAPSSTYGVGSEYPAYYVSWEDAQAFITALNAHITATGQGPATLRLPSEAEWEYACRAGTQTRFHFGDSLGVADICEDDGVRSQYMWYCGNNTDHGSKPVGGKFPNGFGLHDMSGNLWEWCEDWWHSDYTGAPADGSAWVSPSASGRVLRGGYWYDYAQYCRSANRATATRRTGTTA